MKKILFLLVVGVLALGVPARALETPWRSLFNGKNLEGWETYLSKPQPGWDVPGLKRDEKGAYAEPLGVGRDPFQVFTAVQADGLPALRISGQGFGTITTKESFENYHFRMQFKWGEKKWEPRLKAKRDSGLLYHVHSAPGAMWGDWPKSVEMQIQEGDCGDLFAIGTQMTVPVRPLPSGSKEARVYDPRGELVMFELKPSGHETNRAVKLKDCEKPHGEWNTIDLICLGDDTIHVVNGTVVMRLHKARRLDGPQPAPLTKGAISLQTEGAEVFYRDMEIRPISEIPAEFAEKPIR
jgi:hypothetical protein